MKQKQIVIGGAIFDCRSVASFEVDPLKGFSELCPEELPVPGALGIVKALDQQAQLAGLRIVSKDAHPATALWKATPEHPQLSPVEGHKDLDVHWNMHCVPGTKGFELLPGLDNDKYDFIVYKGVEPHMHPYGACFHDLAGKIPTGVIDFLLTRKAEVVIVGGLATRFCVKNTVLQLCEHSNMTIIVNLDACSDLPGEEETKAAIQEMSAAGAIVINNLDNIKVIEAEEDKQ